MSALAARMRAPRLRRLPEWLPTDLPDLETPPPPPGHNGGPGLDPDAFPLEAAAIDAALAGFAGQERLSITFAGPLIQKGHDYGQTVEGTYMTVARMGFLAIKAAGQVFETVIGPLADMAVLSIDVLRSREEVAADREQRRIGERLLKTAPTTRDGYAVAFEQLADAIAAAADQGDGFRRRRQLEEQLDDLAETIGLAKAKRRFLVADAHARRDGGRFDPSLEWDMMVRAKFEQPLPQDFDPDPAVRRDRATRRAARMADPLTAELELMRLRLRKAGLDAWRPRNAPYLLVRFAMKHGKDAVFEYQAGEQLRRPSIERAHRYTPTAVKREDQARRRPEYATFRQLVAERAQELRRPRAPKPATMAAAPDAATSAPVQADYRPPLQLSLF